MFVCLFFYINISKWYIPIISKEQCSDQDLENNKNVQFSNGNKAFIMETFTVADPWITVKPQDTSTLQNTFISKEFEIKKKSLDRLKKLVSMYCKPYPSLHLTIIGTPSPRRPFPLRPRSGTTDWNRLCRLIYLLSCQVLIVGPLTILLGKLKVDWKYVDTRSVNGRKM